MIKDAVAWHDVECHAYDADLPLWVALAAAEGSPVLDIGAGTGRVALQLAAAGHEVTALDVDGDLLDALRERADAAGVAVETVVADAQGFDLGAGRFALVVVPMQTIQLLGDRPAFLRAARRALRASGLLAVAIADELTTFEPDDGLLPDPDVAELDGRLWVSQPVAVRVGAGRAVIERIRTVDGRTEPDAIELALLDAPLLADEARAAGFSVVPGERIAPTPDHVGSAVVLLRA